MEWWGYFAAIIGVLGTLSGVWLGWKGKAKSEKSEIRADAAADTALRKDVEYIKRGIDDLRAEQRTQCTDSKEMGARLAKVEGSASSAHERIDRLDRIIDAKA